MGWRISMEDAHAIILKLTDADDKDNITFFAVYDGHGGSAVAKYAGKTVHGRLDLSIPKSRPSYVVSAEKPGTDVVASVAAAFAVGYLLYSGTALPLRANGDSKDGSVPSSLQNATYAQTLLTRAQSLYAFARTANRIRSPTASSLPWTTPTLLPTGATSSPMRAPCSPSLPAAVLHPNSGLNLTRFQSDTEAWLDPFAKGSASRGSSVTFTPGGLAWWQGYSSSSSLNPAINAAAVALVYSGFATGNKASTYLSFAHSQIDYVLGKNPMNGVYMVGQSPDSAENPHSAMASGGTDIGNIDNNHPVEAHVLYGALVGGPNHKDRYHDIRSDYTQTELALDLQAGLVFLAASQLANSTATQPFYVGLTTPRSYDHKPTNQKETARITGAGGFVEFGRVNGNLALSRALDTPDDIAPVFNTNAGGAAGGLGASLHGALAGGPRRGAGGAGADSEEGGSGQAGVDIPRMQTSSFMAGEEITRFGDQNDRNVAVGVAASQTLLEVARMETDSFLVGKERLGAGEEEDRSLATGVAGFGSISTGGGTRDGSSENRGGGGSESKSDGSGDSLHGGGRKTRGCERPCSGGRCEDGVGCRRCRYRCCVFWRLWRAREDERADGLDRVEVLEDAVSAAAAVAAPPTDPPAEAEVAHPAQRPKQDADVDPDDIAPIITRSLLPFLLIVRFDCHCCSCDADSDGDGYGSAESSES
ncbi:hypothetical protein CF328_g2229 [Tilletia controversa]|nr:hypothetical protein CF328_g2229 [Tilletia controversa]